MTNGKQSEPEQRQKGLPSSVTIVNESTPLVQRGPSSDSRSNSQRHANRVLSLSTEPSLRKKELTGIAVLAVSASALAASSLFVKLSEAVSLNFLEIAFARAALQTLYALFSCAFLNINPFGSNSRVRIWLLARALVGAIGILLFYYSMTKLYLAEATVLFFLGPAFTSVLLGIFTNEPFTLFEGFCTAFCIVGVILLIQPPQLFGCALNGFDCMEGHVERATAIAYALLGAVMSAVAYITARKSGRGTHFMIHVFYIGLVTSVFCIGGLAVTGTYTLPENLTIKQYLYLASVAALSCIGQTFLNRGLKLAPQGPGILLQMAEVVFASLFGIAVLQEYPDTYSLIGSALIVGMTTALSIHRWQMVASLKISSRARQRHSRGERQGSANDEAS